MKHRIFAVVCACLMLFSVTQVSATANVPCDDVEQFAEPSEIAAFWDNIHAISLDMSRSGGNINWSGNVIGFSGTTRITAAYTLERDDGQGRWVFVGSWSRNADSSILMASGSAPGAAGTYRLTVRTTVTRNGVNETVTLSSVRVL